MKENQNKSKTCGKKIEKYFRPYKHYRPFETIQLPHFIEPVIVCVFVGPVQVPFYTVDVRNKSYIQDPFPPIEYNPKHPFVLVRGGVMLDHIAKGVAVCQTASDCAYRAWFEFRPCIPRISYTRSTAQGGGKNLSINFKKFRGEVGCCE